MIDSAVSRAFVGAEIEPDRGSHPGRWSSSDTPTAPQPLATVGLRAL